MTLKYILVYHKCLSLQSAVTLSLFQKTIKVIMKLNIKMYLSPSAKKSTLRISYWIKYTFFNII